MKHAKTKAAAAALTILMTAAVFTGCAAGRKNQMPTFTDTRNLNASGQPKGDSLHPAAYNGEGYVVIRLSQVQTAQQTVKEGAFTGYVTSIRDLNVRSEPRATSTYLGGIPHGSAVAVKGAVQENGKDTGWYQIDYNGSTAYVAAMYVGKEAPDAQQTTRDTAFTGYVVSLGDLNVRMEPRATSGLLGTLPRGSKVEVKAAVQNNGKSTDWYQIDYNGKTAYVAAMYVSKTAPGTQQTGGAFTGYVISAGDLNVREEARATSRRLGTLPRGSKVQVKASVQENGKDTGWYEIDYNGKTAYVAAMYVGKTASGSQQTGTQQTGSTAFTGYVISLQDLNVRAEPKVSAPCLGRLSRGSKVEVKASVQEKGRDTGWYEISYDGKTAYVAAMYVGKTAPAPQQTVRSNAFTGFVTSVGDLNVRAEPKVSAQRLGGLSRGSQVNVRGMVQENGKDTGWYQITYNGKTAYVAAAFVGKTKPGK